MVVIGRCAPESGFVTPVCAIGEMLTSRPATGHYRLVQFCGKSPIACRARNWVAGLQGTSLDYNLLLIYDLCCLQ